ncbi:hypothetical protein DL771_007424 [Monosporascus sp. 5C6A]|nr:hypothetical protein DL771_007424 [Monosporascus sp. 5C6A]
MKREIAARDFAAQVGSFPFPMRHAQKVDNLRKKRGTTAREKDKRDLKDLHKWEAINHNMSSTLEHDMFTPLEDVFGANTSCILAPRWSDGVDLFLEAQYIDTSTCEPTPAVAVGIWNCNATGTYSGLTDHNGAATFKTVFPGHYSGRAVHTQILAHTNARMQSNGTISVWKGCSPVAHIRQLFWPDGLREEVEATYPYTLNTQPLTSNDEDMWSIVMADESFDPIPQFAYLGDSIQDGLFAWIQIGINSSADYIDDDYYSIAGYIDAEGGHSTGSQVGGSGEGGPEGNGTMPSGGPGGTGIPSGAPPASTSA